MKHFSKDVIFSMQNVSVFIQEKQILHNISFDLYEGDFVIIIGGNGAGKSTLFDVISAKKRDNVKGDIIYQQQSIKYMDEVNRARFITRIFQNTHANCVGSLSILENIALSKLPLESYGFSFIDNKSLFNFVINTLKDLEISTSLINTPMYLLSGGQRQLISFIMSMFLSPKILLLDEPTAALDPQAATKLLLYAKNFIAKNNITAMLITHDPHIAIHLGNRLFVLENGTLKKVYNSEEKKNIEDPNCLLGQIKYNQLS